VAHSIAAADHTFTEPTRYDASVISKTHDKAHFVRNDTPSSIVHMFGIVVGTNVLISVIVVGMGLSNPPTPHGTQSIPH
jgi:hypothetical protein